MSTNEKVDLANISRIHFVGVGGIGMSGLARLFLHEGKKVSGSDRALSEITEALTNEGLTFCSTQTPENITSDIDLVVYTEALPKDHPELVAAHEAGIPTINYFEGLGLVANEYFLIAVAGSHGKTTTTAMLIDIFEEAGHDPSAIVGSLRAKTQSNYRAGKSKYFIVEACEYKRDFLSLKPDVLVITNIEYEHVDYYKSLEEVQQAFRELAHQIKEGGMVTVNFSDKNIAPILEGVTASLSDYGKFFDPTLKLKIPGMHNQLNAAAAIAAAAFVGIQKDVAKKALEDFSGTWRRFEYKGEANGLSAGQAGTKIYDDYGHHPTEIRATLQGARELYPDKKITVVFQPHTYSRTHELFTEFVTELGKADRVILLPIYAAREENTYGVTHTKLAEAIKQKGVSVTAVENDTEAVALLKDSLTSEYVVITMGAGDMTPKVAHALVS